MKKVTFTAEEADWLTKLLLQRISLYTEGPSPKPRVIDHCISAMFKLEEKLTVNLKDWEKTMCNSVVNEILPVFYNQVEVTDAFSLVGLTSEQRSVLEYIDQCKSILKKLSNQKAEAFTDHNLNAFYRDKFAVLNKLKSCDLIYISSTGERNVYKIAFVYQGKEASVYELSHRIRPDELTFYPIKMNAVEYGKKHFTMVTDRSGALDVLSSCDEVNYLANQLSFFRGLLN